MFKRKGMDLEGPVDTLIGKQASFEGVLKVAGSLRVDGAVSGEIQGDANIVIGESGRVTAGIQAKNVILAGEVRGNIAASGRTEITGTGRLYGDLRTKSLVIDEGAVFQGNCLTEAPAPASAPAVPAPEPA